MTAQHNKQDISGTVLETRVGAEVPLNPEVSVIIPAYNCAQYISESVAAALSQTYGNHEVIVVNDGSDDTAELESALEQFYPRITYLRRENGGAGAARNSGIVVSRGEYLGFVDGDDVWYPEFLSEQFAAMKSAGSDMVYCDALFFGDVETETQTFAQRAPSSGPVTPESLIRGTCNVILSGSLVKKEAVVNAGMFLEETFKTAIEDYELWFRLAKNGVRIHCNPKVLLRYRVHASNTSGSTLKIAERSIIGIEVLRDRFDLNESETIAVEERLQQARSQYLVEKAKIYLAQSRFEESLDTFNKGAAGTGSAKLKFVGALLRISPKAARGLYKLLRRNEFDKAERDNPDA